MGRLDSCRLRLWGRQNARRRDTAVQGSNLLREAICCEMPAALAKHLGLEAMDLLLDVEKSFDHRRLHDVALVALRIGYPAEPLLFALMGHRAVRFICYQGSYSMSIYPVESILAGCVHSTSMARAVMTELLDHAHAGYMPRTLSWVHVLEEITAQLLEHGVMVKAMAAARGVGVDAHVSARRALSTWHQRRGTAKLRASRLTGVVRCYRLAAKLTRPGAEAQARWGSQSQGASLTGLARRQTHACSQLLASGDLEDAQPPAWPLLFGPKAAPEYEHRRDIRTSWLNILEAHPQLIRGIESLWEHLDA